MRFHRVITAFDGSPQSYDALALALRLRDPADRVLTLACVVSGQRWHVGSHVRRPDATVPEEISSMFAEARTTAIPAGIHVLERAPIAPSPACGLTELAESEAADLIVIGSSRHAAAGVIRLERTAGRLLERARCTVAIAPGGLRETGRFRHIGVAYDESPEARAALDIAYQVAAGCGAEVSLMYALTPFDPEPPRSHAEAALAAAADAAPRGLNPRTALLHGRPGEVIRHTCDGIVDLLVTGSHGYGSVQRTIIGSVSEALTEGASYPTLVVSRGSEPPGSESAGTHVLEVP